MLFWRERLFFHDRNNQSAAFGFSDHAPIAKGIGRQRAQHRHCCTLLQMVVAELGDGGGANQRSVSRQHQNVVVASQSLAAHHDGVPRSALFALLHKADAVVRHGLFHALSLMADDGEDVLRRNAV